MVDELVSPRLAHTDPERARRDLQHPQHGLRYVTRLDPAEAALVARGDYDEDEEGRADDDDRRDDR